MKLILAQPEINREAVLTVWSQTEKPSLESLSPTDS